MVISGFILSHRARDINGHSAVEIWITTADGPRCITIPNEPSVCFIHSDDQEKLLQLIADNRLAISTKPLTLKSFTHRNVYAVYAQNLADFRRLQALASDASITLYEDDIKLSDRYMMERFIRGSIDIALPSSQTEKPKCKQGDYLPTLKIVSLDIECSERGELYSIGLDSPFDSRVFMIGAAEPCDDCKIDWVSNEAELLKRFMAWVAQYDPDAFIGWNVIDFDFKLLHRRCEYHRLPFRIGRDGQTAYFREISPQQRFISVPGRLVLDGIDSLKSATYQFPSWSLENVSQTLLGMGKKIENVYDRMGEINHLFRHDKVSLARYNLQDCVLVNQIFSHTNLIEYLIQRSVLTGLTLDRIGGSVAAFTNLYLPQLHRNGYVAPNLVSENWQASPGGYVMDSTPGLYNSVLVLDFKSLYPSIIRTFLIDPMGLIEGLELEVGKDHTQAVEGFRGGQFHRQRHMLPAMIESLWQARDEAKRLKRPAFSQAIKIIMNSFYGVLGSSGCRFFDTRLASSITMRGHDIMKKTRLLIEEKGYEVIYGDTDSTFVSLGKRCLLEDADKIGNMLAENINAWWQQTLLQEYGLTSHLEIEYETHYQRFLMPTIRGAETGSKKRYAGLVVKDDTPSLVFKGLETARSDWTPLAKRFQQALYQMVFDEKPVHDFVVQLVNDTREGKCDEELIYQKRLRRRLDDYQKNVPPHVRAARIADIENERIGRPLQYQNRGTISYVITVNGPEPVEYQHSPIDYDHYVDKQLRPIAEAILPFIKIQFDDLIKPQLGLF